MAIDRYDSYGPPRLAVVETGAYLIRDVLDSDGQFSGVCEYAVYGQTGDIGWGICREGADFSEIKPFLAPERVRD